MRVRIMHTADVAQVAALSEQLGYPTTAAHIAQRFQALSHNQGHGFFVATHDKNNKALGWVHIYGVHLLETEGYAEIGGLVVDSTARRQGVGRALMQAAEQWAQEHGYQEVRLRSGAHRHEAHLFYQRIGYTLTKTSYMFRKPL